MKFFTPFVLISVLLAPASNAAETDDRYMDFLVARSALLDSLEHAIAPLDTDGLQFVSDRDEEWQELWYRLTSELIGNLRGYAEDYRNEPTLENAMRFEFGWQRIGWSWHDTTGLGNALDQFIWRESATLEHATSRDDALAILALTSTNREALRSFRKRTMRVSSVMRDLDLQYLSVTQLYISAASAELERTGWTP